MSFSTAMNTLPPKETTAELDPTQHIFVLHPGYAPPRPLLHFTAYKSPSGIHGVPFSVVLDACCIIANNKPGTLRVLDTVSDFVPACAQILPPGLYTYHVAGDTRYAQVPNLSSNPRLTRRSFPVCVSFRAWCPPRAPPHWSNVMGETASPPNSTQSTLSQVVKDADGRCIVTGDTSRLNTMHLVPRAEEAWWKQNRMIIKTLNEAGMHSPPNCIALRADLIGVGLDLGFFALAPYAEKIVIVCLSRDIADFATDYHLRQVTVPPRIHPLNLYSRFAWGIFRL
ncbi:hypothetical protein C8J57DRAFT_1124889, partial [Mycena rebaudengoi]